MALRYTDSYIDDLFEQQNLPGIYELISSIDKEDLPEEFWLFCRTYEWVPSRSGVWQYFEGLTPDQFQLNQQLLRKHGLTELADRHLSGSRAWEDEDEMAILDQWLDDNYESIHSHIFELIQGRRDALKTKA